MTSIDWNGRASIQERSDEGSDMFFEFREVGQGTLAEMVRRVVAMPAQERARVVIDAGATGTMNVHDIVALSQRPDFPA